MLEYAPASNFLALIRCLLVRGLDILTIDHNLDDPH